MYKDKNFLAVIPARGGSKRLPGKNLLDLHGKPLIAWTIEAGLKSKYIDNLIVSSEDNKILETAKIYNANLIRRPRNLARDESSSFDVIKHAIDNLEEYDYVVMLQPTSPLRNEHDIDNAIEFLFSKNANAVVSVCAVDHSPLWSSTLEDDCDMTNFLDHQVTKKRSQELDKFYRLNGAIYISSIKKIVEEKTFFLKNNIYAYIMKRSKSVDIDTKIDFKLAEVLLKEQHENISE